MSGHDRDVVIRDAIAVDEPAWRELWRQYLAFYGANWPESTTAATWRRIQDPGDGAFGAIVAERGGRRSACTTISSSIPRLAAGASASD